MTQTPEITGKSWAMVAILAFTWGGTFLVTELALTGITPFWLAAGRIGFAAALMLVIWLAMGGRLFSDAPCRRTWGAMAAIGAFSSAIPFMLLAWGQQYVTSGFAGVSMASVALTVLPLAHFLVPGERLTWRRTAGFLIGFAGVCVLIGGRAFESTGAGLETAGRVACISAACCYGISSVLMRRLPKVDPIGLSTVLLLIAAVIVVPAALIVEGLPPLPSAQTLLIIAFLGLVPTAAANFLRVTVIRTAGPVFMSLTNYQVPIWSVLMGILLLGEPAPPSLLLALVLILAGVGLSQYGALRRMFARNRAPQ
ncbi:MULTISPECIES: DMT family transporter [Roseobacteraceae]|jgi:drug/metabolite transporter (DMT)-like permease|uniref:S-adenosylmethionine/S-adenosylhomocysteine transporter n=1 Tax=Pseudosulfitobacter pseudonitzschiae TaxID=1402135 RepID=A0A221JYG6_9RHOB|nr:MULTISPECIES: DMT family transporter [Roseobacteraceae]ASM71693.1 S-adenosylmethionine/S-adenosylhomocysteine transporter [Pseudosulfitobacter pseudonitzschiae]